MTDDNRAEAKGFRRGQLTTTRRLKAKNELAVQNAFNNGMMQGLTIAMEKPDVAITLVGILKKIGVN